MSRSTPPSPETRDRIAAANQNVTYAPVFNIQTPDANSFRRSQGQIEADIFRTMRRANGRHN